MAGDRNRRDDDPTDEELEIMMDVNDAVKDEVNREDHEGKN